MRKVKYRLVRLEKDIFPLPIGCKIKLYIFKKWLFIGFTI